MEGSCESSMSQVVVLLLGEKQSGKSSAGNTILGRRAFPKATTCSSKETSSVLGKQVTIVDTPGWLSHFPTPERVSKELRRGLALCRPEPHAILLVLPITSTFSQQNLRAMEVQLALLHTPTLQRTIVLFTYGDILGSCPIQEHIRQQGKTLHWLLERCDNRYQVINNWPGASRTQVGELFEKIQKMVGANIQPSETKQRLYSQLRQEVIREEERPDRREGVEMMVLHDRKVRQKQWMASESPYRPREFPAHPSACTPSLSLILLGRRKSGKSSAGNVILARETFHSGEKTVSCSVACGQVSMWNVTVVDTPGWSLFCLANPENVKVQMTLSSSLCPVRSKVVFLLAIPVDFFWDKDRTAVEKYLKVFGTEVWTSTVVLFTFGEELRGRTIEEHIRNNGEPLQWVLNRCDQRYHVLNTNTRDQGQVFQLLQMVDHL